jgi:NAD(P)-dependent dehydrogenase (short-subunit alcohol dehydrogenase family)
MQDVHGKVAVVTGAASGIGRGMCEAFADAGMRVVLADVERSALERTTGELRARGAGVHAVVTDVSKPDQLDALAAETLRHFGAVHVVCNNAGVASETVPSWSGTLDDWSWVLGVNLMGVIHGVRTFLPILIDRGEGGHIVNTASLAGLVTGGNVPYAVSKFGVVALSEGVYFELKQGGYRPSISVLCPGFVNTNILDCARNRPQELSHATQPMTGPVADAYREWFTEQLRQGLDPRRVGDQVLAAIREDRFYILTHPHWNGAVEHRMRAILAGENPTVLPPPGFESLLQKLAALTAGQGTTT